MYTNTMCNLLFVKLYDHKSKSESESSFLVPVCRFLDIIERADRRVVEECSHSSPSSSESLSAVDGWGEVIANDMINMASSSAGQLSDDKMLQRAQGKRTRNGSFSIPAPGDNLAGNLAPSIDNEGGAKVISIVWYALIAYDRNKFCLRMTLRELQ
jgi:hypothetical protein